MERATGFEPVTSSLGTITSRETEGTTETKRAKIKHFTDRHQPCFDLLSANFPPNVLN